MYVDNKKISSRQTFRLYVFDLMGIATLLLPPYLSKLCGVDGIFAILLGTGAGFLYLFYLGWIMKQMKTDLTSFLQEKAGGFVRNLVYLFVMLHSIFTAGFCAYVFADLMHYSLVREASFFSVLLAIVVVAAYAISGGIESRARVYEVLFWIVLVPYIAMMLATIKDFEPAYVDVFFEASATDMVKGTYLVFLFLMPLFFSLFLIGEKEKNYGRNMVKTISVSIAVSAIILLGSYLLLVGNFGEKALATMRYPVVTIMSTVQFKGNFLKRMDALMLAVWFFTLYALLNLHLHYGVTMVHALWKKNEKSTSNRVWKIMIPTFVVFLIAYGMHLYSEGAWYFVDYYSYIAVPLMIFGPLLLLLAGRKKDGEKV